MWYQGYFIQGKQLNKSTPRWASKFSVGGKPCPCASADLNDLSTRVGNRKREKHQPRHEQSGLHQLILRDVGLQSVPTGTHLHNPHLLLTLQCSHIIYIRHTASNSEDIQVWIIKTDTLVDSNINWQPEISKGLNQSMCNSRGSHQILPHHKSNESFWI